MPSISIIVPVYNVEKYLSKCVDSILNQTFTDFEVILVDDGSQDNCPMICDEYESKDSRVRVIHKQNGGVSAARNTGIDAAEGRYIMFCDSDDYVLPQWCETLVNAIRKAPKSYVFCGMVNVYLMDDKENECIQLLPNGLKEYTVCDFYDLHIAGITGFVCNVIFDASVLRIHNVRFHVELLSEDLPFCLEYLKYCEAVLYCGRDDYCYLHRNEETLSTKFYQDGGRKWVGKYQAVVDSIQCCVPPNEQEIYFGRVAEYYLFYLLRALENSFDFRSELSLWGRLRYNQNIVNLPGFAHCLQYCSGHKENQVYLSILRKHNYYAAFFYAVAAKAKNRIVSVLRR